MPESRVTLDRNDIETWADEHDAVPVREGEEVRLVREADVTTDHERLDWDTFHSEVDEGDRVVTYYGEDEDAPFEVHDRDDALDRFTTESEDLDRDKVEQRLIEGETITGTVTETTVIEETVVEEATLESEVVDTKTVDHNVVDVELLDRDCRSCDVTAEDADFDYLGTYGTDRFLDDETTTGVVMEYDEYPFDVTVEVSEDWAVTIEELYRYTVETDVTDVDVSETEEVEARDFEADIDVDAVHQQLLDSDIIDVDEDVREGEVVDTDTYDIESEFRDEDVLVTYLTSRRRFQRELSERSRLTTEVVEGELVDREIVGEKDVETGLAERGPEYGTDTEVGMDDEYEADVDELRVLPAEEDEGKPVVDSTGDKIGEVMDVNDGVAFVDPHPSITEKIMARLGVDEDDEYYELHQDSIDRITGDEVVVTTTEFEEDDDRL